MDAVGLAPWTRWLGEPDYDADGVPRYQTWEVWLDGVVHAMNAVWVCWSIQVLVRVSSQLPFVVYAACTALLCASSAAYNLIACGPLHYKPHLLRKLDHAAIYLFIGGCYTPLFWRTSGFPVIWVLCLTGAFTKLTHGRAFEVAGMCGYLALGAFPLLLVPRGTRLHAKLLQCSACYAFGATFYLNNKLRGAMAYWHVCVLAGNVLYWRIVMQAAVCARLLDQKCFL